MVLYCFHLANSNIANTEFFHTLCDVIFIQQVKPNILETDNSQFFSFFSFLHNAGNIFLTLYWLFVSFTLCTTIPLISLPLLPALCPHHLPCKRKRKYLIVEAIVCHSVSHITPFCPQFFFFLQICKMLANVDCIEPLV